MTKKFILAIVFILFCAGLCFAQEEIITSSATLERIRAAVYPKYIRVVFDLSGDPYYSISKTEEAFNILFINAKPGENLSEEVLTKDWIIPKIKTETVDAGIKSKISMPYDVQYNILKLDNPSRLVIDFSKNFSQIKKTAKLADGVIFSNYLKVMGDDYVTAQIIDVDLAKADVFPSVKKKKGFNKARVSELVKSNNAIAGINGTYFNAKNSIPLGILMVDGELMSYPISDRTALVITRDRKAFIDNISLDAYFGHNGEKYSITGINEPRTSPDDIILYTPAFGELTLTNKTGCDLAVNDSEIKSIKSGNSWIPENGFVLSAGALYAENLLNTIKLGDKTQVTVNVIPYSTSISGELMHLIGGGPRLLKSGRLYISKYEEKFKRDIASGRAARTAVGTTKDNHVLLITVDGKPRGKKKVGRSLGMTLTELAYFMQSIGAQDALNLDGGGSTTMSIYGTVVNRPVDGAQRRVSNAILIKPR